VRDCFTSGGLLTRPAPVRPESHTPILLELVILVCHGTTDLQRSYFSLFGASKRLNSARCNLLFPTPGIVPSREANRTWVAQRRFHANCWFTYLKTLYRSDAATQALRTIPIKMHWHPCPSKASLGFLPMKGMRPNTSAYTKSTSRQQSAQSLFRSALTCS
jgi:hypothetical protein